MQQHLSMETEAIPVETVLASLRRLRMHLVLYEYTLQEAIARQFNTDGIPYTKEFVLGPRNRIDFMIPGGIGVEAKKGKPNSVQVTAQVARYAQFDDIKTIVLVVERNDFSYEFPPDHKPVHLISLAKLWGIAL